MLARVLARTAAGVVEGRGRRIGAAEGSIVPHIGPEPSRRGLAFGQHRHGGVVGVEALGRQHVPPDCLHQGGERRRAGSDAIRQGRGVDRDAFTGKGVALPVQRLVQHELRNQYARQQVRTGEAARDRVGGCRRLSDAVAIAARHLLAHVLDDLPTPRLAFERTRHDLVELTQPCPTAFGAGAGRRIDDPLHRQVGGQHRPGRTSGAMLVRREGRHGSRGIGLGFCLSLAFLHVGDGQLKLLDQELAALGRLSELLPAQLRDEELQLLGFEAADQGFAAQRHDHRVGIGEVGRELIGGHRHTSIRSQPSRAARLFAIRRRPDATSSVGFSSRCLRSGRRVAPV